MAGIALFGGSFDPIHHGHLIIARSVAEHCSLDRVVFLPTANPPHKSTAGMTPANHRAEMVRLAIANEPRFDLSDFDLLRPGPTYTIETIDHFRGKLPDVDPLCWIIGADSLNELPTWYRVHQLVDSCRIVTAARPGYDVINWHSLARVFNVGQIERLRMGVLDTPRIDISATEIRSRARRKLPIRYLVPDAVADYIHQHKLYTD